MSRKRKPKTRKPHAAQTRPSEHTGTDRMKLQRLLLTALIVVVTVIAYIPAMQGGFIWDDDSYVTENANLRSAQGLVNIWLKPTSSPQYYPLVFTSFWIEHQLWGLDPTGYHVVNVLLHAANAVLLLIILTRLQVPGAWLAALVFALHPVCVESVAWVTERKNVLSGLFYFAAAICLLRYFGIGGEKPKRSDRWKWYVSALTLFVAALLSKTVTASLPVSVGLLYWWKRGKFESRALTALLPFFALGLIFGLTTVWLEKYHVGALGPEWDLSIVERFLLAGRALWFYAGKLIWPQNLVFNYSRWDIDASVAWQYAFPLGVLIAVGSCAIAHRRIGRGPVAGILIFCATLFPALGFFDVFPFRFSYVADHFQYHAAAGLIALFIGGGAQLTFRMTTRARQTVAGLGVILLVPLFALTWRQGYLYKDIRTLWTTTLRQNPSSALAHHNLGVMLAREGKIEEGVKHLHEALRLEPDAAEIHSIVGIAMARLERFEEAEERFREAVRLRPDYAKARYYLALLLDRKGMTAEAIEHLSIAVQLRPNFADAHYELGLLLGNHGHLEKAAFHFSETLRIEPGHTAARKNLELSRSLLEQQRTQRQRALP